MSDLGVVGWSTLSAFIVLQIAIGGVIVHLMDRLNKAQAKADGAERVAENAAISIITNKLEVERLEADLVTHRVDTAKEYVSKGTLESLENRIVDAINRLGDRLDKMMNTAR